MKRLLRWVVPDQPWPIHLLYGGEVVAHVHADVSDIIEFCVHRHPVTSQHVAEMSPMHMTSGSGT